MMVGKIANMTQKDMRNKRKRHKVKKNGCDLLVIRIDKNGNLNNSKPCNDCIRMLKEFNINRVYYSNSEGKIICEKVSHMTTNYTSSGFHALSNLQKYGIFSCQKDLDKEK